MSGVEAESSLRSLHEGCESRSPKYLSERPASVTQPGWAREAPLPHHRTYPPSTLPNQRRRQKQDRKPDLPSIHPQNLRRSNNEKTHDAPPSPKQMQE